MPKNERGSKKGGGKWRERKWNIDEKYEAQKYSGSAFLVKGKGRTQAAHTK